MFKFLTGALRFVCLYFIFQINHTSLAPFRSIVDQNFYLKILNQILLHIKNIFRCLWSLFCSYLFQYNKLYQKVVFLLQNYLSNYFDWYLSASCCFEIQNLKLLIYQCSFCLAKYGNYCFSSLLDFYLFL